MEIYEEGGSLLTVHRRRFGEDRTDTLAYCRVSTDSDEQLGSLETQIRHYESTIRANPEWEFAGIYVDEGITGTKKEKRPELLRMIDDCENRKIDLIVTKSISRFARNTTDCLELVRKLLALGIFIYFEKENIHTGSMESELMLSILSGMAENESVSIAENNKWSVARRFQNGTYKLSAAPYGYDVVDGQLIVNEVEAEIVRFIFAKILSGKGSSRIAEELNRRGVPTRRGARWSDVTIRGMVGNERYVGDAIFQKTYTDEYFNRHTNNGEKERYLVKGHHEPIISREDFEAAQSVIARHAMEGGADTYGEKCGNRYPFSGKIICRHCGGTFKRQTHAGGRHKFTWCCATHLADIEKCPIKFIPEAAFEAAFVTMMNKLIFGHQAVLAPLLAGLRSIGSDGGRTALRELEKKLEENAEQRKVLAGLTAKGYLEPTVYNRSNNELAQEAERIQRQKESLLRYANSDSKNLSEVTAILHYAGKTAMLTAFDGELFTRFVERILVYSRTEIGFDLKCGITLKERLGS